MNQTEVIAQIVEMLEKAELTNYSIMIHDFPTDELVGSPDWEVKLQRNTPEDKIYSVAHPQTSKFMGVTLFGKH